MIRPNSVLDDMDRSVNSRYMPRHTATGMHESAKKWDPVAAMQENGGGLKMWVCLRLVGTKRTAGAEAPCGVSRGAWPGVRQTRRVAVRRAGA